MQGEGGKTGAGRNPDFNKYFNSQFFSASKPVQTMSSTFRNLSRRNSIFPFFLLLLLISPACSLLHSMLLPKKKVKSKGTTGFELEPV